MKLYGHVLNEDEKKLVHQQSIKVLEEVGLKFPSERALSLLEKNGAKVDWDKQIAYISEEMVKDALAKAPKEFTLGGRDPEFDLKLPSAETVYNLDGAGIWTFDYELGKRRKSTTEDMVSSAIIFDELDICNVIWPPILPTQGEFSPAAENIFDMALIYKNYRRHLQVEATDPREVPLQIAILKAILGSVEEIKRRKIYSVTYCTIAPLSHEEEMMEATMDLCHYEVPILAYPMAGAGSTGPASLYSNLVLANAETLSCFVLFQNEKAGVPIIFGSAAGTTNKRNGMLLEGATESTLVNLGMQEMGAWYGFPTEIAGCLSDAKEPGRQAVMEKALGTLPLVMAGADIIQGIGLIETSMTLSLEQILIDEEIAKMCRRLREGIDTSDAMDFFEDIKAVGPGGHFLKQKSTRATFRSKEHFDPLLADRDSYEQWERLGSPEMYKSAHKRVKEILAAGPKNPLPVNMVKEIDEIVEEANRVLGE